MASIDREHPEFIEEIQRRERAEEKARMDHKFRRGGRSSHSGADKRVRITFGKAYDSEHAPLVHRFQTPFGTQSIFNEITSRHKSAREAKQRFYWNADHKFWYTESAESMQKAKKELEDRGYTIVAAGQVA